MPPRRLNADEAALWARVKASVRALHPARPAREVQAASEPVAPIKRPKISAAPIMPKPARVPAAAKAPVETLDGGWDRRIARGGIQPDSTLDLHGHTLRSAHALLDRGLERSIARGDRVLLLITGKPPRPESERPHARGAIRAAIRDWIAASRHASAIAAVRNAHPRHGGSGAIYVILRRNRPKP